jgi:four helix bundle protein
LSAKSKRGEATLMQDSRKLQVWSKAHKLALATYRETRSFPKEEIFGLTSQIRRCAGSIGANIAEGCGRGTDTDFARFLQISMGSASELEYHLLFARDLGLLGEEIHKHLESDLLEVKKMLASLIGKIRVKQS